jgi:hypothetical protein
MPSILYAIGFTAGFLLCQFFGYNSDTPYYQQALQVFSGFCFGGLALCVIEAYDE